MQRKLLWGMVGGGQDSQIGSAHRIGAGLDGFFDFAAGALDIVPEEGARVRHASRDLRRASLRRLA